MALDRQYMEIVRRIKNGEKIAGTCQKCGGPGQERQDNGLLCGCWCDRCFEEMVRECRSKSW